MHVDLESGGVLISILQQDTGKASVFQGVRRSQPTTRIDTQRAERNQKILKLHASEQAGSLDSRCLIRLKTQRCLSKITFGVEATYANFLIQTRQFWCVLRHVNIDWNH